MVRLRRAYYSTVVARTVRAMWQSPSFDVVAVYKYELDLRHITLGNTVAGERAMKYSRAPRREAWKEDRRTVACRE